jgi:hypothetical protein
MTAPRARFVVRLATLRLALLDPRLGDVAVDLMLQAAAAALGLSGEERACFACRRPWAPDHHIAGMVAIESIGDGPSLTAGLCGRCVANGQARDRVIAAFQRDVAAGTPVAVSYVHGEHTA